MPPAESISRQAVLKNGVIQNSEIQRSHEPARRLSRAELYTSIGLQVTGRLEGGDVEIFDRFTHNLFVLRRVYSAGSSVARRGLAKYGR